MATYQITAPDGSNYEVTAPDSASQDAVMRYAQAMWNKPQAQKPQAPEDPGTLASIGIGFGRTADKMLQGVKQAGLAAGSLLPGSLGASASSALDEQKATQAFRDSGYAPLQEQHPLGTLAGEALPLLAVPMGGSVRAAMALGSLPGLVSYGTPGEKLAQGVGGAVGSAAGYGVGKAIGSVISPGIRPGSPEVERLAQTAAENNLPLDAAQRTGNPVLQNVKAALGTIPWTASSQAAKEAQRQTAYNASLLKYIGVQADAATPDVMSDAYKSITGGLNSAAQNVALTLDDKAVSGLADVEKTYLRRLPTDQKPVINSYLQDLTELIGVPGGIPGDVYAKTRSELGRIASGTNNITLREGAKGLQRVLDDAFDRQAPPESVALMKEARGQYAKYLTLTSALEKSRNPAGNLGPKQVYAQAQQDIPGFERDRGNFANLVRAGRQFLPEPIPNSGTPQRQMYTNLLTAGSMSGLGALAGAMAPGENKQVLPGAALGLAGFGLSRGAQGALNSQWLSKYLASQMLTDAQKAALARGGGLLGLLAGGGAGSALTSP